MLSIKEFATEVRKGEGRFRVDRVVLNAGKEKFRGNGALTVTRKKFKLDLTLSTNSKMPTRGANVWTEKDFWKVSGRIEDKIRFVATNVSTCSSTSSGLIMVVALEFGALEFVEEKMSPKERRAMAEQLKQLNLTMKAAPADARTREKGQAIATASFVATMLNVKRLADNKITKRIITNPFIGKTTQWNADTYVTRGSDNVVALVQRDEDLEIHMRSTKKWATKNAAADLARFNAVLSAVGFTHGFNPWPYRLRQRREGKLVLDRLTPPVRLPRTVHAPFDATLGHSNYPPPVQLVTRFFTKTGEFTDKISELLFLFRQAGDEGVHFPVRTLALCSLLEGLVRLLFKHLELEKRLLRKDRRFSEFLAKRAELITLLNGEGKAGNTASARLAGVVGNAEPLRMKDKFFAIVEAFRLDNATMKKHFDAWWDERNALMHGTWGDHENDFANQARIAGAINILLLKLFGYSGKMVAARFAVPSSEVYLKI